MSPGVSRKLSLAATALAFVMLAALTPAVFPDGAFAIGSISTSPRGGAFFATYGFAIGMGIVAILALGRFKGKLNSTRLVCLKVILGLLPLIVVVVVQVAISETSNYNYLWLFLIFVPYVLLSLIAIFRTPVSKAEGPSRITRFDDDFDYSELKTLDDLCYKDPFFSSIALCPFIAMAYEQLQEAWAVNDIEPVRPFFDESAFEQLNQQLYAEYISKGRTNHTENAKAKTINFLGWYEESGEEILVVQIKAITTNYVTDDRSGKVIYGYKDKMHAMIYRYLMSRPADEETVPLPYPPQPRECPECGFPLANAATVMCPYCGTTFKSPVQSGWVICGIQTLEDIIIERDS